LSAAAMKAARSAGVRYFRCPLPSKSDQFIAI
jgi:hypothetical protein